MLKTLKRYRSTFDISEKKLILKKRKNREKRFYSSVFFFSFFLFQTTTVPSTATTSTAIFMPINGGAKDVVATGGAVTPVDRIVISKIVLCGFFIGE